MAIFTGANCPVCNKKFSHDDDIVVCPVCGAPHHRTCYQETGVCAFTDQHLSGKSWHDDRKSETGDTDQSDTLLCPRCTAKNPVSGIFCNICGTKLKQDGSAAYTQAQHNPQQRIPSPMSQPFGGLKADEEIDGISARDLALYVGENSFYYLPRFKAMKDSKKPVTWNWSGFFLNFFYFFYRKMYLIGGILLGMFIVFQIPNFIIAKDMAEYFIINFTDLSAGIMPEYISQVAPWIVNLSSVLRFFTWFLSLTLGLFSNKLYMDHVYKNIRKIKGQTADCRDDVAYADQLTQKGRVNRKAVVALIIVSLVLYFGTSLLISLSLVGIIA